MKKVLITVKARHVYPELINEYENPIENACCMNIGDTFVSVDGKKPDGLCGEAWSCMEKFVIDLANGMGNFFDGWMKNPFSAMVSCNDGFRPVSFYLEVLD